MFPKEDQQFNIKVWILKRNPKEVATRGKNSPGKDFRDLGPTSLEYHKGVYSAPWLISRQIYIVQVGTVRW